MPCVVLAAINCQVIEYPNNFEVVCNGDAKGVPEQIRAAPQNQTVTAGQTVPRLYNSTANQTVTPSQTTMSDQVFAATVSLARGKHRPQPSDMDAARTARITMINDQLQQDLASK